MCCLNPKYHILFSAWTWGLSWELEAGLAESWVGICIMWWSERHSVLSVFFAELRMKTAKYRVILGGTGVPWDYWQGYYWSQNLLLSLGFFVFGFFFLPFEIIKSRLWCEGSRGLCWKILCCVIEPLLILLLFLVYEPSYCNNYT